MLDIKFFRENIEVIRTRLATKKFDVDFDAILACDAKRRALVGEFEAARSAQNAANKEMAAMKKRHAGISRQSRGNEGDFRQN